MKRLLAAASAAACLLASAALAGPVTAPMQADDSRKISISTATTTEVVAAVTGQRVYVTNFNLHSAGTTTTKLVYGTGTNCGTGTTDLTDVYDFVAGDGMVVGVGLGIVLFTPPSQAVCVYNSAAVHVGGSLAFAQR